MPDAPACTPKNRAPEERALEDRSPGGRVRRAVVADDSRIVRRVAGRILGELGFSAVEAASTREALDQVRLARPELLVLDWKVGGESGLEAIAKLRDGFAGAESMRILMCSARRDPDAIRRALRAGADDYIMKPFDSDILESKLALVGLGPAGA